MIFLALAVVILASIPLAGGRLLRLADVRVARFRILGAAIFIQLLVITFIPGVGPGWFHPTMHVLSYGLVGWFLFLNRHLPGALVMGAGGLMNSIAIAANDGVMPATRQALRAAGLAEQSAEYMNSAFVDNARLVFLGDVFGAFRGTTFSTLFSLGDVVLVAGAVIGLHRAAGSDWRVLARRVPALGQSASVVLAVLALGAAQGKTVSVVAAVAALFLWNVAGPVVRLRRRTGPTRSGTSKRLVPMPARVQERRAGRGLSVLFRAGRSESAPR